jgi:hypothetical protein
VFDTAGSAKDLSSPKVISEIQAKAAAFDVRLKKDNADELITVADEKIPRKNRLKSVHSKTLLKTPPNPSRFRNLPNLKAFTKPPNPPASINPPKNMQSVTAESNPAFSISRKKQRPNSKIVAIRSNHQNQAAASNLQHATVASKSHHAQDYLVNRIMPLHQQDMHKATRERSMQEEKYAAYNSYPLNHAAPPKASAAFDRATLEYWNARNRRLKIEHRIFGYWLKDVQQKELNHVTKMQREARNAAEFNHATNNMYYLHDVLANRPLTYDEHSDLRISRENEFVTEEILKGYNGKRMN